MTSIASSPTATAQPPAQASPSRSTTTVLSRGGKPGPANTGVPAGTKLTVVNGDRVYTTNNQVISGVDIHGFVRIPLRSALGLQLPDSREHSDDAEPELRQRLG
jgi:hypothetical protein